MSAPDAVVVGSGPNGLAAAVILARAGLDVELYEAADELGGGLRSKALFRDDIVHDVCAAVHPMAAASRFFRAFDPAARGVDLLLPEISYAHPLDGGRAGLAHHSLDATCERLGPDGPRWRALMAPLLDRSRALVDLMLSDQRHPPTDPAVPFLLAGRVLRHGTPLAGRQFTGPEAAALLAGVAAHVVGPMPTPASAAVGLLLGHLAHGTGWPVVRGGSGALARALADDFTAHGGRVHTGRRITDLREFHRSRAVLLDVGPKEFLRIAAPRLPARYRRALAAFRYGPGAAKVDYLLSGPVPWANPEVGRAATVHLGGSHTEVFRQETLVSRGVRTDRPFVLVVDPAAADPSRARPGARPLWAYAHVPNGDDTDPVALVTARIEAYAPGFTDTVLASRGVSAAALEHYNPNYVGGDIAAGAMTLTQSLIRPTLRPDPHTTPLPGVYLCSAATPPGPGVHGMPGYYAARSALRHEFGLRRLPSLAPHPPA
ncbi:MULTISPECIES: NAD(P)/FAD-dependent oxidoreductase [Kitasatospora]|uniref:Putative oxidoreductase n=1 Tax=Kitasatospora setae (strain ATCC 33774 / DSM 43861 / JCM 3304 / KCC A-0304 / NBRC 14216 / KM-6054) TaxID=452652 RepID=E4NA93_KITSK|nr:NAD(P)/FAD-dependent oxidoreductase [Kitasatospora setae]BAJ28124.1 putative oxidoreductase [Kitasatospora setae KM-6054]